MNPLGLLLLPPTVGPNDLALRRHRCYLQPSQRRRRDSILDRGFRLYGPPLAAPEGLLPPIYPRRDQRCEPLRSRESAYSSPLSPLPIISFQTEALWMIASEHSPFEPPFDPSARRTPRWDDVPAINFNTHSGSTISPVNVTRAIEVRRARFHRLYALTHDLPLGVVRGIWSWSRNTPSCHYRGPEPPGGRTGSTWNSCVVHRGGTTASSV